MIVNRQQVYETLNSDALDLFKRGRYADALDRWTEARAVCRGFPIQEFSVLAWMAQCNENLGRPTLAVANLEELLALKQSGGYRVQHELVDRVSALKRLVVAHSGRRPTAPRRRG